MDTRYWGPDGWRLLHSIAVTYPERPTKQDKRLYSDFFRSLKLILPCIYCRNSFSQYIEEIPIHPYLKDRKSLSYWVYLMHNKVNDKLAKQDLHVEYNDDFIGIHNKYLRLAKNFNEFQCQDPVPGWDFIYSVLFNYPKKSSFQSKEPDRYQAYTDFFYLLAKVLPFPYLRDSLQEHITKYPVENYLSLGRLKQWGHALERTYCKKVKLLCPNYQDRCYSIELFRAGCNGKNDPKPTCHI